MSMYSTKLWGNCFFSFLLILILSSPLYAQTETEPNVPEKAGKEITAWRINPVAPKVDGRPDDDVWQHAQVISDFVQVEPNNGESPTERTTTQVAYDDHAIYVLVIAYDAEPDKIKSLLSRRDNYTRSECIKLEIDSRHDHQTGYGFAANPDGIQLDYYLSHDDWTDFSWNGVWEVATNINDQGWVAEFRIPFSMFRFPPKDVQVWGFQVYREICRKNEQIFSVHRPRDISGNVSRFGHLLGIENIQSPRQLELLPYTVTKETFEYRQDDDFFAGAGMDLKYGLSSNFTVDMTFNPDFGQVEADPSVLNLSAFETWYPEKRPFFMEGSDLLNTPYSLFYSRRIGKSPGRFDLQDDDEEIERPQNTTIIGAAKLTGKSSNGLSVAVLEALTSKEYATVLDSTGKKKDRLIEPMTNFFVGRVQKDILDGNSTVGLIGTAVNRLDDESAYSGGLDWNLKFRNNRYFCNGQVVGSLAGTTDDPENGYAAQMTAGKSSGKSFIANMFIEAKSPDVNLNDLGFLNRNDWIGYNNWMQIRRTEPVGFIRSTRLNLNSWLGWNYDGDNLSKGIGSYYSVDFLNYWGAALVFNYNFEHLDDSDTFRDGSIIKRPGDYYWNFWFWRDERKKIQFIPDIYGGWNNKGGKFERYDVLMEFKLSDRFYLHLRPSFEWSKEVAQWVDNIDDNDDGTMDHYVYSELKTNLFRTTMDGSYTLSRNLSVQMYVQPFIAVGKYSNFKELTQSRSFDFQPYAYDDDLDFNAKFLNANIVLRWEYRPGSRIYLVWTNFQYNDHHPGKFDLQRDFKDLFTEPGTNIFLVKVDYWFNI